MNSKFGSKLLLRRQAYLLLSIKYGLSFGQGKNREVGIKCFPMAFPEFWLVFQKDIFDAQNLGLKVQKEGGQISNTGCSLSNLMFWTDPEVGFPITFVCLKLCIFLLVVKREERKVFLVVPP